jgi:hypothetical protein
VVLQRILGDIEEAHPFKGREDEATVALDNPSRLLVWMSLADRVMISRRLSTGVTSGVPFQILNRLSLRTSGFSPRTWAKVGAMSRFWTLRVRLVLNA